MLNEDTIQYAIENTQVIVAPQRRSATFGDTSFRFYLVTEMMDSVNQVRVRDGRICFDGLGQLEPEIQIRFEHIRFGRYRFAIRGDRLIALAKPVLDKTELKPGHIIRWIISSSALEHLLQQRLGSRKILLLD